ncbi:hypothetical protein [Rickettsiella massiliensis]|uniref:hypothetical protein n=1 Tax=Rickettsiella massiliensis TaxID=676517 RepID=UPI00067FB518|nr:hypothetical protein [Rickettsiella massiliensis]
MSLFSPFALLRSQRFFPLFTVQFLGSCNDNLLKNALITSLVYQFTLYQVVSSPQWQVTLAAGLFILPFVFFSAFAGEIADQVNKSRTFSGLDRYSGFLSTSVIFIIKHVI